jgi:transposase-like protein
MTKTEDNMIELSVVCPYCGASDITQTHIGNKAGQTLHSDEIGPIDIDVNFFCNNCGRSWSHGEEDDIRQRVVQQRLEEKRQAQEQRRQEILSGGRFDPIRIEGSVDHPTVVLDRELKRFEISGRSLPEDVMLFYTPIFEWLRYYQAVPLERTVFDFKLEYYNTASSNRILDIMLLLEDIYNEGHDVLIRWHYPDDNEDLEERGEEYADLVKAPFEMVPYSLD